MLDEVRILLTLIPAEAHGSLFNSDCQYELRQFYEQLRASEKEVMPRIRTRDRAATAGNLVGEFDPPGTNRSTSACRRREPMVSRANRTKPTAGSWCNRGRGTFGGRARPAAGSRDVRERQDAETEV